MKISLLSLGLSLAFTIPSVAATPDACGLFTKADAEALFHKSVKKSSIAPFGAPDASCHWEVTGQGTDNIIVMVEDVKASYGSPQTFSTLKTTESYIENVPGLGDAAFYSKTMNRLDVLKGDRVLGVVVEFQTTGNKRIKKTPLTEEKAAAIAAARQMLPRL